ncbi:hypothetical protein T439DRAFT_165413 [Meredithblackwellia eburnea MCA 4105]
MSRIMIRQDPRTSNSEFLFQTLLFSRAPQRSGARGRSPPGKSEVRRSWVFDRFWEARDSSHFSTSPPLHFPGKKGLQVVVACWYFPLSCISHSFTKKQASFDASHHPLTSTPVTS